jgi:protein SCO1/2
MNKPARPIEWLVWGALILTIAAIVVAFAASELQQRGSRDVSLSLNYPLPDFTLTNQNGQPVSLVDLQGQVWVADIIFTRCGGPCPVMTQRLSELQSALPAHGPVKLVTLTADPEFDTPERLQRFGQRFGADFKRWMFLTGPKAQLVRLAVDGLKLVAVEKKSEERENERDLFIHSELFVIVDKQGRLRGSVESYDPEVQRKVLAAVQKLLRERG